MKIARLRWTPYHLPFRAPYTTAHGSILQREGVILELTTDSGEVGYGEASRLPHELDTAPALTDSLHPILMRAIGSEVTDWLRSDGAGFNPAAHCALTTAVCDAYARRLGLPLAQVIANVLRLHHGSSVPVNALIGGVPAEAVREDAAEARAAGYGTVKLKVGMGRTIAEEIDRVAAAREALGNDIHLRLDANGAWDEATAVRMLSALANFGIEYVEQPLPPGNLEAMQRIRTRLRPSRGGATLELSQDEPPDLRHVAGMFMYRGAFIAADEDVSGWESASAVIKASAADILIIKPLLTSGYTEWLRLLSSTSLPNVITTSIDTGIGTALALQLAAAIGGAHAHGLATLELLEDDLITNPLPVERGSIKLPEAPGLGVELDYEALERYSSGWSELS